MRPATLTCVAIVLSTGSLAAAQITYQSQSRSVRAGTNEVTAPDFAPFNETASFTSQGPNGPFTANSTHASTLGSGSIDFNLHATASGGVTADSLLTVTFTVPAGSTFSLTGHTYFGQAPFSGSGRGLVTLTGPGVNLTSQADPLSIGTFPFSFSGTLAGGSYTLVAEGRGWGASVGGIPMPGTGDAIGTLTIVPTPGVLALLGLGAGLAGVRRRRTAPRV